MKQSSAHYQWTAEDGSLTVRILIGVVRSLVLEMVDRREGHAEQACGVLVGTNSAEGTPVIAVESIATLPIQAGVTGAAAVQLLFDKWPRSRHHRVYGVGAYRFARPGYANLCPPELVLTKGTLDFPAVELIVEGPITGGIAASICFQASAHTPVRRERLVFPQERPGPLAQVLSPTTAEAAASSFGIPDRGRDGAYIAPSGFWSRKVGIAIGGVAALSIATGMVIKPYKVKPNAVPSEVRTERAYPELGLSVERVGGNLIATWNRQAEGIVNATDGILSIQGLDGRHDLTLDREQLLAGGAVYPATIEAMTFRLQIFDSKRNLQAETLRVLSGASRGEAAPYQREPQTPAPEPAVRNPPKPFQAPGPKSAGAILPSVNIPDDALSAVVNLYPAPVEALGALAPATKPDPPQPERIGVAESPAWRNETAPARQQQSATAEQLNHTVAPLVTSAPVPVTPVSPVLPANVKALIHKRIEVNVTVSVDASGRVIDAAATIAGANSAGALSEFIREAATSAARLWRFEPARANQRSVPGTCVIVFKFGPN